MKDYFLTETKNGAWHKPDYAPSVKQKYMWTVAKDKVLNPIREHLGVPVFVTSGLRNGITDYNRLKKQGYYPSFSSDHNAGLTIAIPKDHIKHKKYGDNFDLSTFALDIDGNFDKKQLCRDMYLTVNKLISESDERFVKGLIHDFKQLICEEQIKNGKTIDWIHLSLPYDSIYTPELAKHINKNINTSKFLKANNGRYALTKFE